MVSPPWLFLPLPLMCNFLLIITLRCQLPCMLNQVGKKYLRCGHSFPVLVEEVVLPAPRSSSGNFAAPTPAPVAAVKKINFCPNCGTKSDGGKFCSECGQMLQ